MEANRIGQLYRAIDVWERRPEGQLVRYRCFEVLASGGFCVQSADFHPQDEQQMQFLARQYLELLAESAPDERARVYPTLQEAIAAHQNQFGSDAD